MLAGNHDVMNSGQWDDQRTLANEPFLQHFPASLQASNFSTFQGTDDTGFNSYHLFQAEGREYLVLALDWLPSEQTVAWVQDVLDQHPETPRFSPPINCWASAPMAKPPCSPPGPTVVGRPDPFQ